MDDHPEEVYHIRNSVLNLCITFISHVLFMSPLCQDRAEWIKNLIGINRIGDPISLIIKALFCRDSHRIHIATCFLHILEGILM